MSTDKNHAPKLNKVAITVYPAGYALVQGQYALALKEGTNRVHLDGMPTQLNPDSLYRDSFQGPGEVTLGPVTYRAANLAPQAVLARSLNKRVTVFYGGALPHEQTQISGNLLSLNGNVALVQTDDHKVREVRNVQGIEYAGVPEGLSNTPALSMTVEADKEGEYLADLLYTANGFSWRSDHKWIYNEKTGTLNWDGFILLSNHCGATFDSARLSVAAGDAGETGGAALESAMMPMAASFSADAGGGAKRSRGVRQAVVQELGQVKLYDVPGTVTIDEGDAQNIPFFTAVEVPARVEYRFGAYGQWFHRREVEQQAVRIFHIINSEPNKLGTPLPGGPVSIWQRDSQGLLRRTGGGTLQDIALNEEAEMSSGEDFDVKLTRKVLDVQKTGTTPHTAAKAAEGNKPAQPARNKVTYAHKCVVEVFNGKREGVEVTIHEALSNDCQFQGQHGLKQTGAGQFEAVVSVPAGGTNTIEYTIEQTVIEEVAE